MLKKSLVIGIKIHRGLSSKSFPLVLIYFGNVVVVVVVVLMIEIGEEAALGITSTTRRFLPSSFNIGPLIQTI